MRRQGLGRRLLNSVLDSADVDGLPTFLDTSVKGNLSYYERAGFRVTVQSQLPNGIPLWGMTRQPKPVGRG